MKSVFAAGAALLWLAGVGATGIAMAQHGKGYNPHAAVAPNAKDPQFEKLKADALKLEKQLKVKPRDATLRTRTAEANYQAGHAMMLSPKLDRKVKYRGALVYFRRALALNPHHRQASDEKKMIEMIYRQLGRPIPG